MLRQIIESKYVPLVLAIIGYCLAVVCVIVFLNINGTLERILWAIVWLVCCALSDNLFRKFKKIK